MAEVDLQQRDRRGEWLPDPLPAPSPLFSWPLRLLPALRAVAGQYWPYGWLFGALAVVSWLWFTPDLGRTGYYRRCGRWRASTGPTAGCSARWR